MKRIIGLLLLLCLPLAAGAESAADSSVAPAPKAEAFRSATEYQDESLHVWIEDIERDDSVYHVAHVEIVDPSQLRTAVAGDTNLPVSVMASAFNAVVAINGDSFSYGKRGLIIRQGETLQKSNQTKYDLLLIDTAGDFHALRKPTKQSIAEALETYDVVDCFAFGPVLVMDGEVQPINNGYGFSAQDHSPRTAVGQIGPLSYVLVVVDGRLDSSRGVTHKQLAKLMGELGCTVAYNLDGGGSSELYFGGVYNTLSEGAERDVSDILYFTTLE